MVVYPSQKGSVPTDPTDVVCTGLFNQYDLVVINPSQTGSVSTDPTDKVCTGFFNQVSDFKVILDDPYTNF